MSESEGDEPTYDEDLAAMNNGCAVVFAGKEARVFDIDEGCYRSFDSFANFYNKWTKVYRARNAEGVWVLKTARMGKWWLSHAQRRQHLGVRFMPQHDEQIVDNYLNTWKGFTVKPERGNLADKFYEHMLQNICSGNYDHFDYLMGWLASRVQRRGSPAGVAIVLKSETEGTGKGFFAKSFGYLFGPHFKHIGNADHLVGKFNSHLADTSVLFADEAFYANDRRHEGVLKMLITEEMLPIERKGIDVVMEHNYLGVIMASNNRFVVPAGHSARRYFVLEVATHVMQDSAYFAAIQADLDAGGYANLLHDLLAYDLTDFQIRDVPKTAALAEQKSMSLPPDEAWWCQVLEDGELPGAWSGYPSSAYSTPMFRNARERSPRLKEVTDHALARFIKSKGATLHRSRNGNGWKFPPLQECRAAWTARFPGTVFAEPNADWTCSARDDQGGLNGVPY